ncbi:hypothetical protein ERJ75_000724000 [Trypanosoma vivax]|nr:hypothetical protein ERJ75_000724000 [Trypanosoma vivax]
MPATEPLFATVSLLLGDVLEMTLRVPITDETTVRLLAKETMQRLLARQRNKILRNGQCFSRETIAVTDVFVNDGSNKAEVFAQDLVTQVIRVKDEVVYMHLQIRDARKQEGGAPVLSDVSAARTAAQDTPSSASSKKPSGGKSESVKKLSPVATPNAVKSSEKQKTGSLAGTKRTATQMNEDGVKNKQSNAKQQGAKRAAGEGRLGGGRRLISFSLTTTCRVRIA